MAGAQSASAHILCNGACERGRLRVIYDDEDMHAGKSNETHPPAMLSSCQRHAARHHRRLPVEDETVVSQELNPSVAPAGSAGRNLPTNLGAGNYVLGNGSSEAARRASAPDALRLLKRPDACSWDDAVAVIAISIRSRPGGEPPLGLALQGRSAQRRSHSGRRLS